MLLSIIIPVFNEENTIGQIINKIKEVSLPYDCKKEIIVIDDASDDNTNKILNNFISSELKVFRHEKNRGKGSAIRTGLKYITGDYVIIQDADLEYDPRDFVGMLNKIVEEDLLVLYGSRQLNKQRPKYSYLSFYLGGLLLTKLTNLLYKQNITDEATCYKMFSTEFIKNLPLKCEKFEFCPEVTSLVAKKGIKIREVGIDYCPRNKADGKKIKWKDGLKAMWVLLKNRVM